MFSILVLIIWSQFHKIYKHHKKPMPLLYVTHTQAQRERETETLRDALDTRTSHTIWAEFNIYFC